MLREKLLCPACREPMHASEIDSIVVDECPKCLGLWFEDDELRSAKDKTDDDLRWMDFDLWRDPDQFQPKAEQNLACPICEKRLRAVQYGTTGIAVHCCGSCRGVWLDRDEFRAIIEALSDELTRKDVGGYLRSSLEEAKEVVTGPETLASEWKDLKKVLWLLQLRFFVENPRLMKIVSSIPPSPIS